MRKVLLLLPFLLLQGCYYMQAAAGHWEVMRKREPVEAVIADADTPPDLAQRLRLLSAARDYSIAVLGLPDNKSYRTYAALDRDYVVWNVFAAPELSLQPRHWCFPVAGCVSYRGYFSPDDALRESKRLSKDGFDTAVGGVAAYSTLGKFSDPLLSTMMRWEDADLVAVLFHELAHQVVYVKGDSAFNESFATAVEEYGVRRWLTSREQWDQLTRYDQRRELQQRVMGIVATAREDLGRVYAAEYDDEQKRREKKQRLAQLSDDVATEYRASGRSESGWLSGTLNNARLISMTLYEGRLPSFRAILGGCADDIQCFYAAAKALASLDQSARDVKLDALDDGA